MQRKLTKQFLYGWLKEDLYGEQLLKRNTFFSGILADNVWKHIESTFYQRFITKVSRSVVHAKDFLTYYTFFLQFCTLRPDSGLKNKNFKIFGFLRLKYYNSSNSNFLRIKLIGNSFRKSVLNIDLYELRFNNLEFTYFTPGISINIQVAYSLKKSSWNIIKLATNKMLNYNSNNSILINFSKQTKTNLMYINRWDLYLHKIRNFWTAIRVAATKKQKFFQHKLKLGFSTTFTKRKRLVNKNEIFSLLMFRVLRYFNVIHTDGWWFSRNRDITGVLNNLKLFKKRLTTIKFFEYRIANVLLRSGFFVSGYIVSQYIKRQLVHQNGFKVSCPAQIVREWDIITLSSDLWWFVYSCFINFFQTLFSINIWRKSTKSQQKIKYRQHFTHCLVSTKAWRFYFKKRMPQMGNKRINNYKNFSLRQHGRTQFSSEFQLENLLKVMHFVYTNPPSYLEVSYKLFMVLIHSNPSFKDVNQPLSLKSLKTLNVWKNQVSDNTVPMSQILPKVGRI